MHIEPSLLTIAIPTYRRPRLLLQCLQSALNQNTKINYEILVLDDDPNGEWEEELLDLSRHSQKNVEVTLLRNTENLGVYGNWNKCIELCQTEFITILNDDDLILPDYIKDIRGFFDSYDLIAVDADYIGSSDRVLNRFLSLVREYWRGLVQLRNHIFPRTNVVPYLFLKGHPYVASLGVAFRKELAISIGKFDNSLYPSSDYDFFFRYSQKGKCMKLRKKLAVYRWEDNISMRIETLKGWIEMDSRIRTNFIESYLSGISRLAAKAINMLQLNIKAFSCERVNSQFYAKEVLKQNRIPIISMLKRHIIANIANVMCSLGVSIISLTKKAGRLFKRKTNLS